MKVVADEIRTRAFKSLYQGDAFIYEGHLAIKTYIAESPYNSVLIGSGIALKLEGPTLIIVPTEAEASFKY